MGAPAPAKKAPRKRAPRKAAASSTPTLDRLAADAGEISDEDIERLEAEVEGAVQSLDDGPIGPDGEIRPVEIGRAGKAGPELTHIFTLDGEKHYIPKSPPVKIMLRFMREVRDKRVGRDQAVQNAMLDMLGKRRLDLLCESDEVTNEDFANVMIIVGYVLFSSVKRWRQKVDPALDPSLRA